MADFKTAEVMDSAEAPARRRDRKRHTAHVTGFAKGKKPSLTVGNIIHFVVAAFFLWPIFVVVAVFLSLGDAVNFVRFTIEALVSSTYWMVRVVEESLQSLTSHRNDPNLLRVKGRRRAMGASVANDWRNAGRALMGMGRAWSKTFGLGGLFASLEERIERANRDWRLYVAGAGWSAADQPAEFPENYVVVDELPPGGSSARLYVVRKRSDEQGGPLQVLKYFDLRSGGSLESVVRESQAAELAKRLGLITESSLGTNAFWYVMPYYHGETLTKGVLRNIKPARENSAAMVDHTRMSLGYVHQLLQIIAQYHESGVIHKDIKPDNLIIAGERIYLVDIGLMTPLSSMAQLTTHGTEYFRDPEMVKLALEGREVREVDAAKFDVYSIGAVLFFAVSGEFPTSGALSRLPNEVPMAVQWVVNRAMTGMSQRYANARAMLTDVDYLFWAATTGQLANVKPADLPSFKGMPVPPHLAAGAPVGANKEFRQRMAAAPGGYGDWYSAPAYRRKTGLTWGKAAAVAVLGVCVAAAGVSGLWFMSEVSRQRKESARERQSGPDSLVLSLPAEHKQLAPYYLAVDELLAKAPAQNSVVFATPLARVDLVPEVVRHLGDRRTELERDLQGRWARHGLAREGHFPIAILLVCIEPDPEDQGLCQGIEREITLEAARARVSNLEHASAESAQALRKTLENNPEGAARHRELAAWFAAQGKPPAAVVFWSISGGTASRELVLNAIYPGREEVARLRFAEARAVDAPRQD